MLSREAIVSVGARVGAIGGGFLIQVFLARTLSQDDMGRYFLVLSILTTGALLSQLGLQRILVREFAGGRPSGQTTEVVLGSSLGVFFLGYLLSAAAIAAGYYAILRDQSHSMLLPVQMIFLVFLMGANQLLGAVLRGFHRVVASILLTETLVQGLVCALIALWFFVVRGPNSVDHALMPLSLALVLASAILITQVRRLTDGGLLFSLRAAQWLIGQGGPLLFIDLTFLIYNPFVLWVVGLSSPVAAVALFGVCTRLSDLLLMPKRILTLPLEPRLAGHLSEGRVKEAEQEMRSTTTVAGWAALGGCILYVVVGEMLLTALFGESYGDAYPLLVIIALSRMTGPAIEGFSALAMQMSGQQKTVMKAELILGFVAASSMLIAAYLGSASTIAVVYACSYLARSCTLWLLAYKYLGLKSHMQLLPTRA